MGEIDRKNCIKFQILSPFDFMNYILGIIKKDWPFAAQQSPFPSFAESYRLFSHDDYVTGSPLNLC